MKQDLPSRADTPAETQWVEAELVRSMMRTAQNTQLASLLVIPVYLGVLWDDVSDWALLGWVAIALFAAVMRHQVISRWNQRFRTQDPAAQLAFFARVRHVWTFSAGVWAATVWLYFDRSPLSNQFICWLMLAGVAMFAVNDLSAQLPTMRTYVAVLMLGSLALVAWRVVVGLGLQGPYYHYWLMALLVIFWQTLNQAGRRSHLTHRRNFELQYRNTQLINSLTRQTQAALDAIEIKNRFLASATHDIRQPVHALQLYADWLAGEPELVEELAPKIVEATKAVNTLFDSLFDLVRLDTGNVHMKIEEVPLDRLFSELEVQYRPLAQAKGLEFRMHPARGSVTTDALLLRRIVGNLISNAIKYTEHGGVLVGVRRRSGVPCIEVWDTGVGIAPVHQRDIFREFFKVPIHAGTEEGFGLGLYIVSRLSHILGHPVELASRPRRGSVFKVLMLPTDAAQAASRAAAIDQLARRP